MNKIGRLNQALIIFCVVFGSYGISRCGAAETFYVLPDRFEISTHSGLPMFSVDQVPNGYSLKMVFKANYEHVVHTIYENHSSNIEAVQIVELPIEPRNFKFISQFIEKNPLVVSNIEKRYFSNELSLELKLTTDLTKEQVLDLFRFGLVYGVLDGKIACDHFKAAEVCGKKLENIPVYNQYRFTQDPVLNQENTEFLLLNHYKNTLFLGAGVGVYTDAEIDNRAAQDLVVKGQCKGSLDSIQTHVCRRIFEYSPKFSLVETVKSLALKVFAHEMNGAQLDQYVLGPNGIIGGLNVLKDLTPNSAQIAVGLAHSCIIIHGGVQCWGDNSSGELGNNSTKSSLVPVKIEGLTEGVTAITSGRFHTCVIVHGGARCWGSGIYGQLGNNSRTNSLVPVQVQGLTSGVTAISAGSDYSCAVVNGGVQCWGANSGGRLGNNLSGDVLTPVQVLGLTSGATGIAAGYMHTCAIVNEGVQCWGTNYCGQLGNNTTISSLTPVQVQGLTEGVSGITAGIGHTCAIVNDGVQCWGVSNYDVEGEHNLVPRPMGGLTTRVSAVSASKFGYTCAVVSGGVQCWGQNRQYHIGNNSTALSLSPGPLPGLADGTTAIAVGESHACAIVNGVARCWGLNLSGQLGNNSTNDSLLPVHIQ